MVNKRTAGIQMRVLHSTYNCAIIASSTLWRTILDSRARRAGTRVALKQITVYDVDLQTRVSPCREGTPSRLYLLRLFGDTLATLMQDIEITKQFQFHLEFLAKIVSSEDFGMARRSDRCVTMNVEVQCPRYRAVERIDSEKNKAVKGSSFDGAKILRLFLMPEISVLAIDWEASYLENSSNS
ncbi:hypothetical protein K0M31_012223 [Melipona bicolor]|uniref:Uncharacterized protein n=1 Tax=Melipona bicolor TaxID=60889 RepID=A0AA40FK61_9HYME|nr:hypothetical protein K0M31_012223 [Melipona bicolor]